MSEAVSGTCQNCGFQVGKLDRFCKNCGSATGKTHQVIVPQHGEQTIAANPGIPDTSENQGGLVHQGPVTSNNINVTAPTDAQNQQPVTPPPQSQTMNINITSPNAPAAAYYQPAYGAPPKGSVTFAVITLVLYFLVWPVGAILNLIGLISGPRRGCFAAMFFLIFIPSMIFIAILIFLAASGGLEELIRELENSA